MSRIKWSKILVGTAVIGSAVAGGIAYFNKYKKSDEYSDDDFDDFDDDFDKDTHFDEVVTFQKPEREYVSLTKDTAPDASAKDESPDTIFPSSGDNQLSNKEAGQLEEAVEAEVSMQSANVEKEIQEVKNNAHETDDNNAGVNNATTNNSNTGYKNNFGYRTNSNHKKNNYHHKNNHYKTNHNYYKNYDIRTKDQT